MSHSTSTYPPPRTMVPVWPGTPRHQTLGRKLVGEVHLRLQAASRTTVLRIDLGSLFRL